MTAEATETKVTAYFTLEGGLVHQFALDIGIFLLRHITASPAGRQAEQKDCTAPRVFLSPKTAAMQFNDGAATYANPLALGGKEWIEELRKIVSGCDYTIVNVERTDKMPFSAVVLLILCAS